uniref:Protein kinase domain-containing protein n=1 Tax=Macrostomum lignano TaxID=282301 RepID=A0A1I8JA85_9PLAT
IDISLILELYYLIIKFLETGPCAEVATLLPPRKDWTGRNHVRSFEEFDRFHPHVTGSHLVEVCSAMGPLLERAYPSGASAPDASSRALTGGACSSLLGSAVQSLLRSPA